jgi:hypothetical protein
MNAEMPQIRGLGRARFVGLALACFLVSPLAAAQGSLSVAEAKRHFDVAETLYGQGQYESALIEYVTSYKLGNKRSALINAADCQRKLNRFAEAYELYAQVLAEHGDKLKPNEKQSIAQATKELAQLTGTIEIASDEQGAEVAIDGAKLGEIPLPRPKRVAIAKHRVRATKAGFEPFEIEVDIASQTALKIDVTLKPEPSSGRLSVREQNGKPVHVVVDGKDLGPAPWEGDLAPGDHVVELIGDKLAADKRTITVVKRERVDFVLAAVTQLGHLRVTTSQAWARISLDRRTVGYGTWEADVAPGVHQIDVEAGDATANREIVIKRGEAMVQEIPVFLFPRAQVRGPPSYHGAYGGFTIGWAFWLTAPRYTPGVGASVTHDTPQAVPLTVRVGYSFNIVAVEFVGTLTLMRATESLNAGYEGSALQALGISGFFGVGARVSTKTDSARVTASVAPGVVVRGIDYTSTNAYDSTRRFDKSKVWAAPGLHADVGAMFGHSPGGKFLLGAELWLDLPPNEVIGPDTMSQSLTKLSAVVPRNYLVAKTPELFIGPTLGVQWGH